MQKWEYYIVNLLDTEFNFCTQWELKIGWGCDS